MAKELKLNRMYWIDKHKCLGQCIKIIEDKGVFLLQKPIENVILNKEEVTEYEYYHEEFEKQ